jgi:hypothetical protein
MLSPHVNSVIEPRGTELVFAQHFVVLSPHVKSVIEPSGTEVVFARRFVKKKKTFPKIRKIRQTV